MAGSEVVEEGSGKAVGSLLAAEGDVGLAYLKLSPALQAAQGGVPLCISSTGEGHQGVRVVPVRPGWWPREWGKEEESGGGQE